MSAIERSRVGAVIRNATATAVMTAMLTGLMPMMRTSIRFGNVPAPDVYMISWGGMMGFVGGLMGQVVFGPVFGTAAHAAWRVGIF